MKLDTFSAKRVSVASERWWQTAHLPPPGISSLASYFLLKIWVTEISIPLGIFNDHPWGGYGYFLEPHMLMKVSCRLIHTNLFSYSPVFYRIYNYILFLPVSLVIIIIIIITIIIIIIIFIIPLMPYVYLTLHKIHEKYTEK